MSVELLWRHFAWIGIPALALSCMLLVRCIAGVVRTGREARLLEVPLVERQEVRFAEGGPVVLAMEAPMFGRHGAGLEFELVGPDGAPVPRRRTWFRSSTRGVTRATTELRVFDVAVPGPHVLRIEGLPGAPGRIAECALVFARPHLAVSLAFVVGIVVAACVAVASLVLTILRLAGVGAP